MKHKELFIYQHRDVPGTSYLFKVCENAAMMTKAIWKQKVGYPTNAHDIVKKYLYDSDDPKRKISMKPVSLLTSFNHRMMIRRHR